MGHVMLMGTHSGVGKNYILAGLLRLLARKGFRVAPFKALSIEAHTCRLPSGTRISIAQAVQCTAALCEPTPDNNPFVAVFGQSPRMFRLGVPGSTGSPFEGFSIETVAPTVRSCLDRLVTENDFVCVEGAGSPVELGLMNEDVPNLLVARHLKPAIFIVAEMYWGGGFASLWGTFNLLPIDVRRYVRGFVLNKAAISGNTATFSNGIKRLEDLTAIPVISTLPFIYNSGVLDEGTPKDMSYSEVELAARNLDTHADAIGMHLNLDVFIESVMKAKPALTSAVRGA